MSRTSPTSSAIQQVLGAILGACGAYSLGIYSMVRWTGAQIGNNPEPFFIPIWWISAAIMIVTALSATRIPSRILLAVTSISIAFAVTLGLITRPAGGIRVGDSDADSPFNYFETIVPGEHRHTITAAMYEDKHLGSRYFPGSEVREIYEPDYDATYRFDGESNRLIPDKRERIVFAGCSFTQGIGVADSEHFPAVVSRLLRDRFCVVNRGQTGWGTNHALVVCQQEMQKPNPPKVFIYSSLNGHLERNYLRRSWFRFGGEHNTFPFFEVRDGKLTFAGMKECGKAQAPDDAQTEAKEVEVTVKMIVEMNRLCKAKNCHFVLASVGNRPGIPEEVYRRAQADQVVFYDFGKLNNDYFPNDGHPRPSWHRAVAEAFLQHEPLKSLASEPDPSTHPLPLGDTVR